MPASETDIVIGRPSGRYAVGCGIANITDTTRIDSLDPKQEPRRVMVSLFYPIERSYVSTSTVVPYAPPLATKILDIGLERAELPKLTALLRMQLGTGVVRDIGSVPLVLFSPGLTFIRHQYNATAQCIASAGYAVVTMDHPFEAMVVEFPDDATVMGIIPLNVREENAEKHEQLLNTRVADACFILTQMGNLDIVKQLIPEATAPFDVNRAVMMGHSFGGATAVSALMQDARFIAAINMDGSIYGTLSKSGKPVLLFGRGAPDRRDRSNNATWQEAWKHLEQMYEINLKGAVHLAFSDLPLILKLGGVKNAVSNRMVGEIDGERCFEVVVGCVNEFLRMVFQGQGEYTEAWSKDEFPELELGVEGR